MADKVKVIVCTDGIFPHSVGGMQRHSRLLIETLAKINHIELVVLHPHDENVFSPELSITEIHIAPIDSSKNYLLECYLYSKRIYHVLVKYPYHVIYSQGLCVWYHIKAVGNRTIVNPHGLEPYQGISFKDRLISIPFRWVFNRLFCHAAKVVSLGGRLTNILKDNITRSGKIVVLPNAVLLPVLNAQKTFNSDKTKILFIARFAHNKGIHILIEAIRRLNDSGYSDELEFYLGGKGPLFNYYSTSFKFKNVHYLGFISDEMLFELYKTNDIFVLPTLFEGMPTTVLEAMSYGLPVIVSDVGATAELVNRENGMLIKKNDVDQLVDAITSFHKSSNVEKRKLSLTSIEKIKEKYTWDVVAMKHVELFMDMDVNRFEK